MNKQKIKRLGAQRSYPKTRTGLYVKSEAGLKLRDWKVRQLAVRVRKALPWLKPSDHPTVRGWCQLEILCDSAYALLRDKGMLNDAGEVKRLVADFRQLRALQLLYANALGMTPASRLSIKGLAEDETFDLAKHVALSGDALSLPAPLRKRQVAQASAASDDEVEIDGDSV